MNPINRHLHLESKSRSPSGTSSPIFSWSPLPQRKLLQFTEKENTFKCKSNAPEPDKSCYPNCDVNVWLRSCEKEIIDPLKGTIKGTIPKWLNGTLIRNGPGSLKAGNDQFSHLFDSSALLHRFQIQNGNITYQCRFLQSEIYKKNWTANRIVVTEFGTKAVPDPCHSIFQKVAAFFAAKFDESDNAMISVYPFADELYAFNEIPVIHRINANDLTTETRVDLRTKLSIVNHTSHPHVLTDGSVMNLALSMRASGPHHEIVLFPKQENAQEMFEQAKIVASMPARWSLHPSYMHTWGITDNFYIIVEQPLNVFIPSILRNKLMNEPMAGCFRWYHDEYVTIMHLISS